MQISPASKNKGQVPDGETNVDAESTEESCRHNGDFDSKNYQWPDAIRSYTPCVVDLFTKWLLNFSKNPLWIAIKRGQSMYL